MTRRHTSTEDLAALRYVTDERGKRLAVILPFAEDQALLEDLEDLAAIAERRDEPTIRRRDVVGGLDR